MLNKYIEDPPDCSEERILRIENWLRKCNGLNHLQAVEYIAAQEDSYEILHSIYGVLSGWEYATKKDAWNHVLSFPEHERMELRVRPSTVIWCLVKDHTFPNWVVRMEGVDNV